MASDDNMTIHSSMQEDDDDVDYDEDDHQHHCHSMSRLSMCSSNIKHSTYGYDDNSNDDDDDDDDAVMHMSRLSVDDGSDIEADGELSDEKEADGSEDSEKERGWSSLPVTPQGSIRWRSGLLGVKKYASEGEGRQGPCRRRVWASVRKGERRAVREKFLERAWEMRKYRAMDEEIESGDSECMVIAKAKGGGRCLSMDMEEVKACRDLGFQLQNDWTLEIPCRISGSTIDTDSGGNSPITNWIISSPEGTSPTSWTTR
ncbi:uncharacterized protein LOC131230686 isoform X2 [Magnolia sinica]|uniref:uncharacterized protein LOC131230686 isoform X2 n=1 Tax=Magnolia sinica TaxID=86752 RepID=UPI00265A6B0F|nr:uncharacterized protein LOC131230686 isoform X2 [Magnolia sinica]